MGSSRIFPNFQGETTIQMALGFSPRWWHCACAVPVKATSEVPKFQTGFFFVKKKSCGNLDFLYAPLCFPPSYVFPNYTCSSLSTCFGGSKTLISAGLLQQAECFLPGTSILRTHICQGWISYLPPRWGRVPHKKPIASNSNCFSFKRTNFFWGFKELRVASSRILCG